MAPYGVHNVGWVFYPVERISCGNIMVFSLVYGFCDHGCRGQWCLSHDFIDSLGRVQIRVNVG